MRLGAGCHKSQCAARLRLMEARERRCFCRLDVWIARQRERRRIQSHISNKVLTKVMAPPSIECLWPEKFLKTVGQESEETEREVSIKVKCPL